MAPSGPRGLPGASRCHWNTRPERHWQAPATDLNHDDMRDGVTRWVVALLIAVGVLGVAVFGAAILFVALFVFTAMTTPHPGAPIAQAVRAAGSPIVLEVRYHPAVFGASIVEDSLVVVLTDDATQAQALDLWCSVIVPAGGDPPPDNMLLEVVQGEKPYPWGGHSMGDQILPRPTTIDGRFSYVPPVCPAPASGTPPP